MKRAILLALLIGLPSVMALRLARADSIDLKQEGGTFVIPVLVLVHLGISGLRRLPGG